MRRKTAWTALLLGLMLLGLAGRGTAGVEPSPFEPEINKLHSIELQVAAINKRVVKMNEAEVLPEGTANYLHAMATKMQDLNVRVQDVLAVLPAPSVSDPFFGQDDVVFALDSIRSDSKGAFDILENIVSRMGVDPSPFLPLFRDASIRLIVGINLHLLPVLPELPPPQLPTPSP